MFRYHCSLLSFISASLCFQWVGRLLVRSSSWRGKDAQGDLWGPSHPKILISFSSPLAPSSLAVAVVSQKSVSISLCPRFPSSLPVVSTGYIPFPWQQCFKSLRPPSEALGLGGDGLIKALSIPGPVWMCNSRTSKGGGFHVSLHLLGTFSPVLSAERWDLYRATRPRGL